MSPPWARACIGCQRSKIHKHIHSAVPQVPVPARRFSHIQVDLVGPLPSSKGFTTCSPSLERTSHWPEAVPLSSISAADCASAVISGWISWFGFPAKMNSDRGAQFSSSIWDVLCSLLNIPGPPAFILSPRASWNVSTVPWRPLYWSCSAFHYERWFWFLAAKALYRTPLCLPGEFLDSDKFPPAAFLEKIQSSLRGLVLPPPHHWSPSTARVPTSLASADFVFVYLWRTKDDIHNHSSIVKKILLHFQVA